MITERDIAILRAVARFYVLSRQQIQRLCFPNDGNGRITRRRLQVLVDAKLLNRHTLSVFSLAGGTPGAAYYPAPKGCELLATYFRRSAVSGDLHANTICPSFVPLAGHQ
jgi:hypothetical protein